MGPGVKGSPTERVHPRGEDLDLLPTLEVVRRLHREDLAAVEAVGRVLPEVARAARLAYGALAGGGRLIYVGAGTSGRLGALDAAECPPTFGTVPRQVQAVLAGGKRALGRAVEGAEDDERAGARAVAALRVGPRDAVVGISASADTAFVAGALAHARSRRARTILVTCNPARGAGPRVEVRIAPRTGPELLAGSTRLKGGTATKLILNAMSTAAMVALGKIYRGRMIDLKATNRKLKARAERMVADLAGLSAAQARRLLRSASGHPRLALAMHWGALSASAARRRLRALDLRQLEAAFRRRR